MARDGSQPQGGSRETQNVAAAVKAALFAYQRGSSAQQGSRPVNNWPEEWLCKQCEATNWLTRGRCRLCQGPKQAGRFAALQPEDKRSWEEAAAGNGKAQGKGTGKGKGRDQQGGESSQGSGKGKDTRKGMPVAVSWAEKVKLAQAKAQSLEQVAAAARRAGSDAAEQLAREAKDARAKAAEEKPLPVRFQRLEERERAAATKVEAARQDLAQVHWRLEQAEKHLQAVQQEVAELQVELAATQPAAAAMKAGALVPAVRELLARLEGPSTTEDVDELVGRVHELLESRWPTPAGKLDEPLPDVTGPGGRGAKRAADEVNHADEEVWAEPSGGETTFEPLLALASVAQKSDAELGAMARHALLKQRGSPY